MKKKLFIKLILAFLIWSTPFVLAGSNSIPTANEVRSWMISLSDPDISGLEKQQLTARIYYNLDIYRAAAMNDPKAFRPNDNIVKKFQKYRSQMILDVIEKTNLKYRSKYGFNIRGPVIPFPYNNIFSDDDIILSSKHEGRVLEGLFNESLDEVMQKRANISFGKLDRTRIDINGLSWDMSVKAGATRNFFHPEKYINAESGFANQRKLMSGKLFVAEFDTTGRLRAASTKVARDKLLALETDKPLKIKGLPVDIGTASMMDYQRMATMHRIKNFDLPQGATGRIKSTYFSQKTAQFIRNQKYTERLVGDIEDLSAKLKENGSITRTPPEIKKWSVDIGYAKRIRKCLSIGQLSSVLQERYQGLKILNNGIVNFEELKKAMVDFQNLQLKMMNEMVAVGQKLEAPKMLEWIREGGITNKQKMRQRLALRYAPYDDKEIRKILRSLEDSGMNSKDYAFFESVLTDDVKKVRKYANEVRKAMGTDGGFEALQNKKTFTGLFANWMEPSNPRDMLMTELEMRSPHLSEFKQKMFSSPSGKSLYRFSKTKLGKALNIDTILDDSKAGKSTMAIMMTLSFYRAYQSGGTQKGMKAVGLAAFEMIPLVSGVLRISEGEYKNAIKEFVCDFVPPVALARLAFAGLGYAGQTAKADFTERLWEAQALEALENILDDDDFEQTDMGYYRFKDRNNVLELMHEIAPGFGGPWAKLSSLVLPQIEALMSKNKEVETNLAAMETIFYLDPALYLDPATSDIKRFTQKIRKEGIPPQGKTSATVRTLAKLIMRNEEIRAKLRVVVMNQFLNRIEKFYNRKIGNQDDAPEASKVKERKTWAIALLKKDNRKAKKHLNKYLHRKIDSALNDHIKMVKAIDSTAKHGFLEKFTVWLNSFDPETFRNEKIHQYDLKITPNERIDLEQLLMRVIESYRAYIKKLQKMSNWNKDTNSISLKTYIYPGSHGSMMSTNIAHGDKFRFALRANPRKIRKDLLWKVYYYISPPETKYWYLVGEKMISTKDIKISDNISTHSTIYTIKASDSVSHLLIDGQARQMLFSKDGTYQVRAVFTMGKWPGDPVSTLKIVAGINDNDYNRVFSILEYPHTYPNYFDNKRMAFASKPTKFKIIQPYLLMDDPEIVYANEKKEVGVYLKLPKYFSKNIKKVTFKVSGGDIAPKVTPKNLSAISFNSQEPTIVNIEGDNKVPNGKYLLSGTVDFTEGYNQTKIISEGKAFYYLHNKKDDVLDIDGNKSKDDESVTIPQDENVETVNGSEDKDVKDGIDTDDADADKTKEIEQKWINKIEQAREEKDCDTLILIKSKITKMSNGDKPMAIGYIYPKAGELVSKYLKELSDEKWEWFEKDVKKYIGKLRAEISAQNPYDYYVSRGMSMPKEKEECYKKVIALAKVYDNARKEHAEVMKKLQENQYNVNKICQLVETFLKKYDIPKSLKIENKYSHICQNEINEKFLVEISGEPILYTSPKETVTLNAVVSGGKAPVKVHWEGENISPSGKTAIFTATIPGSYSVQVSAKDAEGKSVTDSVSIKVKKMIEPALVGLADTVYYGTTGTIDVDISGGSAPAQSSGKIDCKKNPNSPFCVSTKPCKNPFDPDCSVKISEDNYGSHVGVMTLPADDTEVNLPETKEGEYEYVWISSEKGIEFNPPNGKKPQVKVTFGNIGNVEIWAEVHKDGEKVGETKRIKTKIIPPKFTLKTVPEAPLVGEESRAVIALQPNIAEKFTEFRWLHMGNSAQKLIESQDGRSSTFRLKNTKPATIKVLIMAKSPYYGGQIGSVKHVVTAKPYKVDVKVLGPLGQKPRVWEEGKGLVEVDKEIAVYQNVRLEAKVTPEPKGTTLRYEWKLNEDSHFAGGEFGREVMLNRSQTGMCVATVTIKDKDGNVLGKGSGSFNVSISQKQMDAGKQKAEDQKKAQELLQEGRKLWKDGKLQQAIAKVAQAQKLAGKDKKITKTLKAMQVQKKELDAKLEKAKRLISQGKFREAEKVLASAARISDKYEKYKEVFKKLADAKIKVEGDKKKLAKILKDAKVLKDAGKLNEAVAVLIKGSKQFPDNLEMSKLLKEVQKQQSDAHKKMAEGQVQWKAGMLGKAVETLKKAVTIDTSNRQIGKVLKAMQGQKKTMDDALKKADKLIEQKKFDQTKGVLKKAERISGKYPPYVEMVKKLESAKKKAEQKKKVEEEKKKQEDAHKKMTEGQVQWKNGLLDKAVSTLKEATKKDPSSRQISKALKGMQGQKKMMDDALKKADQLIGKKKFKQTKSILTKAGHISSKYLPYTEMLKKLDLAKQKVEEEKSIAAAKLKAAKMKEEEKRLAAEKIEADHLKQEQEKALANEKNKHYAQGFAGKWNSNYGVMELSVDGIRVTGHYTHDQGRIKAILSKDGKTMKGTWAEAPSYKGSRDAGKMDFKLSNDAKKIDGLWSYGDAVPTRNWTATRIIYDTKPAGSAIEQPEQQPSKEIKRPISKKSVSSLVGPWSFGRSKHYGKPVHEHLCDLVLTDELVAGKGYKIRSCNVNESYWIAEGKVLLFTHLDGTITTRFTKVKPGYWKGTYVGSAHSGEGVVHYLKKLDEVAGDTKADANSTIVGKTKTSSSYTPNSKGDVFNGGHWAGANGGSDWIQKDFTSAQLVTGIYIGRASTDITTKGFKLVLKLRKPNGEWITIDELHNTNINRTALSGGAIGKSIPSYTKTLSTPVKATAFRLEFYGHGWFDATDIRIYTKNIATSSGLDTEGVDGITDIDQAGFLPVPVTKISDLGNIDNPGSSKVNLAGVTKQDHSGKGYWKLIKVEGSAGLECGPDSYYGRGYYRNTVSGSEGRVVITNMIREHNKVYFSAEGVWNRPPEIMVPDTVINIPLSLKKISEDTKKYTGSMSLYVDDQDMGCGSSGGGSIQLGHLKIDHKSPVSVHKVLHWKVKQPLTKKAGEKFTIRVCYEGVHACGPKGWKKGWRYHYEWVPKGSAANTSSSTLKSEKKMKEEADRRAKIAERVKKIKAAAKKRADEQAKVEQKASLAKKIHEIKMAAKARAEADNVLDKDQKKTSVEQFMGTLSGTWSGKGTGDWKGWTSSGTFTMHISNNGKISGNYSGDDKGKLNGSVSTSGKLNMKSGGGSAGDGKWSGDIKVDAYGKLKGSGTWNVDSFKGTWYGNGKETNIKNTQISDDTIHFKCPMKANQATILKYDSHKRLLAYCQYRWDKGFYGRENGTLYYVHYYKDGKENIQEEWHSNGFLKYRANHQSHTWEQYAESGKLRDKGTF